jgi:hypothetical protein
VTAKAPYETIAGQPRFEVWHIRSTGRIIAVHDNCGFTLRCFPGPQTVGFVFSKGVTRASEQGGPVGGRILRPVSHLEVEARFREVPAKNRRRKLQGGWWYEVIQD